MLTKTDLTHIGTIVKASETRIKGEFRKEIRKVVTKLEEMDKFLDKQDVKNENRIRKIENYLHFPQN